MLTKLTQQQEKLIAKTRQQYLDYIFSCKNSIDREKAKIGIEWMYQFCGLDKPIVIFVDSPLACQYAVPLLKAYTTALNHHVGSQVESHVRSQVENQIRSQVLSHVGSQIRSQVLSHVGSQIRSQVRSHVESQVEFSYESFAYYGNWTDLGWISYIDFFKQIGVVQDNNFEKFQSLISSGIYDMIQLNGFCIVSSLPSAINRNRNNQLHSALGPAIEFRDGYKLWFWNGVAVPGEWIESPESITKETIAKETNAERRRCLREIVGTEKFADLLGIVNIGMDYLNGQEIILYKSKAKDEVTEEYHFYIKVTCPSTSRNYFLCVPQEAATDPVTAVAWTFGMTKEEYHPAIES